MFFLNDDKEIYQRNEKYKLPLFMLPALFWFDCAVLNAKYQLMAHTTRVCERERVMLPHTVWNW